MKDNSTQFDHWLSEDDASAPAALVIREHLMPVEGTDGVLFPSTYAASEDKSFAGGYNIDGPSDGENVCLIDSVGSQANRIEPIFLQPTYEKLVPRIVVKAGDREISILEAGHRAGDALVRCSSLQAELLKAFKEARRGNAFPLAKIAPTSLVFGVWDSRETGAKLPRVIASTIRAYNVKPLTRSAQFVPATSYVEDGLLEEPTTKKVKDSYASRGFIHIPASAKHGGVISTGGIRREATLNLAALRLLSVKGAKDDTTALRRYILGLSLVAFTHPSAFVGYLRQGCTLVLNPDKQRESVAVYPDGKRVVSPITHDAAMQFASAAAKAFGVGDDKTVEFDIKAAKRDLASKDKAAEE